MEAKEEVNDQTRLPHTGSCCRDCWQLRLISKGRSADLVIFDDIGSRGDSSECSRGDD
jgi:hypothetical protein